MKPSIWLVTTLISISTNILTLEAYPVGSNHMKTRTIEIDHNLSQEHTKSVRRKKDTTLGNMNNTEIIAVSVTTSVATNGRRKVHRTRKHHNGKIKRIRQQSSTKATTSVTKPTILQTSASEKKPVVEIPPGLEGANLDYLRQTISKENLNNKKLNNIIHPLQLQSNKSKSQENINIPLGRSISQATFNNDFELGPKRYDQDKHSYSHKVKIIHDVPIAPKQTEFTTEKSEDKVDMEDSNPTHTSEPAKVYSEPEKKYGIPEVFYSEPAKVYSEPAKIYSEPAKMYGEPAKIYGEPAKIYGEPAKVYGEPSKFYSKPASLYLDYIEESEKKSENVRKKITTTTENAVITENDAVTEDSAKNNEINKAIHADSNEKIDDNQENTTESGKVGYVVEGKNYRKYRVEERTSEGFIVGEFGVVNNDDGHLRGVRYTAEGDTNPRLIYDALLKFLSLQ